VNEIEVEVVMNCEEVRRHWDLYHDSEGDAELHFQINEHLNQCAACAELFARQSRLEELIAEKLSAAPPDEAMWNSVLGRSGVIRPVRARRWVLFSSLAACAAALLVAIFAPWAWFARDASSEAASLSALTADWHQRLVGRPDEVPFKNDSDLAVEEYLQKEVQFPVRCPPRKDAGFAVEGAGTCRLADQPAAFLVGNVDQAPVSIFILSRDSLRAFPHQQAALERESVHRCREGQYDMALSVIDRNLVLVIGQVEPERLLRVLRAYGTYPHVKAI
jgi:anti-sigma factor RsiW